MKTLWEQRVEVGRLIRLDRPYGTWLLMFPTLVSLWMASEGPPAIGHLLIFVAGSFLMRSAGCVINDMADQKIDASVSRTRERPLAAHRLGLNQAMAVLLILLTLSFLLALLLNPLTFFLSVAALCFALLYPFAKRFTYFPQMILGMTFGWGVILAWTAVRNELSPTPFLIWAGNLFWTVGYDTIYALMDREDDLKIGVKSTAIFWGDRTPLATGVCFMLAVFFFALAGYTGRMGLPYGVALVIMAAAFSYQILRLLREPPREEIFSLFKSHALIGLVCLVGVILHYPL